MSTSFHKNLAGIYLDAPFYKIILFMNRYVRTYFVHALLQIHTPVEISTFENTAHPTFSKKALRYLFLFTLIKMQLLK